MPLAVYTLTPGDVGKYLRATIQPKLEISDPGARRGRDNHSAHAEIRYSIRDGVSELHEFRDNRQQLVRQRLLDCAGVLDTCDTYLYPGARS